ncbi:gamma-glutamyl-gamma-aminobutyrate hydrolase family protein [Nesterenkonia alkaliphila]|uniref:Gamma-glutamyl-gamma-aminobutyrate hydrolase family protein n=1 Tax=Nesterenkonia alkaliphila TaxID=1463631 RepID=A0A7K1UHQ2_9MICC|nr:gamma-glutamyl-gamma-aminobutyrate hydrolase family protein [Nesterenkonia alkaliphila]MVT26003.1 gamma-glutamyl-gamma-aminobutyrate hydrolase family protein [Nesterenkonia alkaliphila]GFZ85963.1 hypothetical protein GCM10011359_13930 [Nesterenkonia alkaliphila]
MTQPVKCPLRILVSYSMDDANVSQRYAETLHALAQRMGQALTRGGPDVQIWFVDAASPGAQPSELLQRADGLVILGGADIEPRFYTSDPGTREQVDAEGINSAVDGFEMKLARTAVERRVPLLGICRGMQVVNVALGGSLIPDIGAGTVHNQRPGSDEMTTHQVELTPGTALARIYGSARIEVRSAHHQAIGRLPELLTPAAFAEDGLLEGYEARGEGWLVGVQWHPEDQEARVDHLNALARAFLDAARRYRRNS